MKNQADPLREKWVDRWKGQTVACIASGPSLTAEDCEAVHQRDLRTIVTNTTYQRCPWADVLFAFDGSWWKEYRLQVDQVFKGDRATCSSAGRINGGADSLLYQPWFAMFQNSGASAISLAIAMGARKVILLGYDCQMTDGQSHWHGDHPSTLSNVRSMKLWPKTFNSVARFAKERKVEVVNCTRKSALESFHCAPLETVLC